MVLTSAIAAAVAAVGAPLSSGSVATLGFLSVVFLSLAAIAAREATGALRHFWTVAAVSLALGAVFYAASLPYLVLCVIDDPSKPAFVLAIADISNLLLPAFWCLAPFNGLVCVMVGVIRGAVRPGKGGKSG
jgi:Na+-driven multidrug efflux pump